MMLLYHLSLLLLLLLALSRAKVIVLNKPVLFKDYPAACKKHNAVPINVSSGNVETLLSLLAKVTASRKKGTGRRDVKEVKGWIAAYEDSELQGVSIAFGVAEKENVPALEILSLEDAEKRGVKNISFCWQQEALPVELNNELKVDTTSPEEDEKLLTEARKEKSRRRNVPTEEKKSEKKVEKKTEKKAEKKSEKKNEKSRKSRHHKYSSTTSSSASETSSSESERQKRHRRQKGRKH